MTEQLEQSKTDSIPFFPDHARTEFRVVIGVGVAIILVGAIGLLFPVGLGQPADPMDTPVHIKPEWYFLALYQLLKYISKTIGASIPVIGAVALALLPFFDRKRDTDRKIVRIRFIFVTIAVILLIAMTIWGEIS